MIYNTYIKSLVVFLRLRTSLYHSITVAGREQTLVRPGVVQLYQTELKN